MKTGTEGVEGVREIGGGGGNKDVRQNRKGRETAAEDCMP